MLNAIVTVSEARRAALVAANQPVPTPSSIRALVDTGASCTCIDPSVLSSLQLTPTGSVTVLTPSTGQTPHLTDQFDVGLYIPGSTAGHTPLIFPTLAVVAAELLTRQGFHALIGRDVLQDCILFYNGSAGAFTLGY